MRVPFRKSSHVDRQRKALEKARRLSSRTGRSLRLMPPEGVPIDLRLASLSQRFGAQLTDFAVTLFLAIIIVMLFAYALGSFGPLLRVIAALTFFFIRVPYYVATELAWNGRTLAKRWLGMRVVSVNGRSLSPHQVVVRNIMKEVEFFAPLTYLIAGGSIHWSLTLFALLWIIVLLIVPWRSKRNQRIGDIIANTAVILDPKPVLMPDLANSSAAAVSPGQAQLPLKFSFTTEQLDHYGRLELQVLEKVLRAPVNSSASSKTKQEAYMADIVVRISQKIAYTDHVRPSEHRDFLSAFYKAQREYLESRKLFGDTREDKFFREKGI